MYRTVQQAGCSPPRSPHQTLLHHGMLAGPRQCVRQRPPQSDSVFPTTLQCPPDWMTRPIPLKTGVYQGNPFSVVIFNTVMCTIADSMKDLQPLGRYQFSQSQRSINLLQYDMCLISDGPASCKRLLEQVERWLNWSGMKAKVPKFHSLALQASTAKSYDPNLTLYGKPIHFIGNEAIKFLGSTI